jgi:23S rRNA pseudouridine2605 synthase
MHPRHEFEREYEVRVQGGLRPEAVRELLSGIELEDGPAKFQNLQEINSKSGAGTNRWYRAVLMEGRNREVRRMIEAVGGRVSRLIRVRFGAILLPLDLPAGRWIELEASKIQALIDAAKG